MENKKIIIATLAFFTVMLSLTIPVRGLAATPNVFIDTGNKNDWTTFDANATGETFTVNVNVTDAVGVAGYGVYLRFDSSVISPIAWQTGGFLESSGLSTLGLTAGNHTDLGYISLGDTLSGQGSANGNGTLVKVTFTTLEGGRCALHLYNTFLYDEGNNAITHTDTDGQFIYNYVALTPSNGTAVFMIRGFGFGLSPTVVESVTWNGTAIPIMPTQCDSRGNFVTVGTVPDNSTSGSYTITVTDNGGHSASTTFTLTAATGVQGPKGDKGDTGPQGPAGTGGSDTYTWAALVLSIIAIIVGIYAAMRKKS